MNQTQSRVDFKLPILSESTLKDYVKLALGVRIPDTKVCPNHCTPWRAFCDAYFARYPVVVWKASRGFGGKTHMLGILGLAEAQTLAVDVNVLGGSGEQSKKVLSYISEYGGSPQVVHLLASEVQRETRFKNGAKVVALTASQTSVRGPHVPRLRMDEIDEMEMLVLNAALGQTMRSRGVETNVVLSSTHQYANGTMTAILERAREKGWPLYEWCYKESSAPDGWLTQDEIVRKQHEITKEMWRVEYDLQEASPESRAILTECVHEMFQKDLGEFEGAPDEYIELEEPVAGAEYATGGDWARKSHFTTIVTARIDVWPRRIVAFEKMRRKEWPMMVERFDARIRRYPGEAAHDATGLGDVISGYMTSEARANVMTGRTRSSMLTAYITAIENNEYVSPIIKSMKKDHEYASNDDVWNTNRHLPDSISAMANLHSVVGIAAEEDTYEYAGYRG